MGTVCGYIVLVFSWLPRQTPPGHPRWVGAVIYGDGRDHRQRQGNVDMA